MGIESRQIVPLEGLELSSCRKLRGSIMEYIIMQSRLDI